MTDFKGIRGWKVQTLSSDPVASQILGGSWSSGGNLPGPRDECAGGGTLTAGIQFAGYNPPAFAYQTETNEYNGTAWSTGGALSNARSNFGGLGTQTAALAVGGQNPGLSPAPFNGTEEYNGSSWTTGGTLPGGFDSNYGCTGTQTAGLQIGGNLNPNTKQVKTLSYNGTSWSDTGHDVPTTVDRNGATGTSTAAMSGGGRTPSATNAFFTYDGSSWTAITNYPTTGYHFHLQGPYTDVIVSGGFPLNTNSTWWDGSSWTAAPDMSNNHGQAAHANSTAGATSGDGFVAGADPSGFNGTEHWNSAPSTFSQINLGQVYFNSTANAFKVTEQPVPGGTWASGANLNTVRDFHAMAATSSDAAIAFGGNPGSTANTEQYDGSSWTEKNNLNTGRNSLRGFGTVSAAIGAGGYAPTGTMNNVESWDGTNWTEVNEINSARQNPGRGGTQTAGILFGGYTTAKSAVTETWDGTSWTEVADMNTSGDYISSFGSQTSAIAGNRYQPGVSPGYTENVVESWNGTSWTETAEMNTARAEMSGEVGATGDLGLIAGGTPNGAGPAKIANTELWNGSSWTEVSDLGTARRNYGAGGPSASGILTGGDGDTDGTEEWTAPLTNKTITVS